MSEKVLSVAIPRPLEHLYTYKVPDELLNEVEVGKFVKVPFGKSTTHAFVVGSPQNFDEQVHTFSKNKLKSILEIGSGDFKIPKDVMDLCIWTSEYYHFPLGEVLHCAAPPSVLGLRTKGKQSRDLKNNISEFGLQQIQLNEEQVKALEILEQVRVDANYENKRVCLVHGITGSGKTELYLESARKVLAEGKSVLFLVPEIALTSHLHSRLEKGLGVQVGLWHSAVADGLRRDQWVAARTGKLRVVVGARSAVFAPLENLGLIIVDEEHDTTYKQEDRVRYNAKDLALVRGQFSQGMVILGSATPSLETREKVRNGRYACAQLKNRYAQAKLPSIELVDLTEEERIAQLQAPFAERTLQTIRETLNRDEQVMIFLNRRGFAAFLLCKDCGHVVSCPNCSISLTVHRKKLQLVCHLCGHQERIPAQCQNCVGSDLLPIGAGTESLEEELPKHIPEMKALRLDRDQITSTKRLNQILNDFRLGKSNTLLGTQMLVKGHDFPNVTLVVVVLADTLFNWPDFRSPERALQVLTQVSGRAGRAEKPGKVLIQTYQVDHPVLKILKGETDEGPFWETERELREALAYPPFGRIARLRFEGKSKEEARKSAMMASESIRSQVQLVEILGPSEALVEKVKGVYRWDILLKARRAENLHQAVRVAKSFSLHSKRRILIDVDPSGLT